MIKSKENCEHYQWGDLCSGWHLLNTAELSVIQEVMPPCTQEQRHYHMKVQQFFFVLKGEATFDVDDRRVVVASGQGIHIEKGTEHKINNETSIDLEFLVISQPHAHGDRVWSRSG